jgi:hypothetical protein
MMPVSYNRRRFLAFASLFAVAPVRSFAQFATSAPPPPPTERAGDVDVKDFGSWRVVSQMTLANATIPAERTRVAAAHAEGTNPPVGGTAAIAMEYWRKVDEKPPITATLTVDQYGPPGIRAFPTRVLADGKEVAAFDTSDRVVSDLAQWFGADLSGLVSVSNLRVVMTIGDVDLVVYDVDLSGTADALAAMHVVADYNYAYRMPRQNMGGASGDGSTSSVGTPCFLTTACCGVVGLADNCPELATLRSFRDRVMLATAEGRADVAHYYAVAPRIVAEIQRRGEERVLLRLYFTTILPAVVAARLGLNGLARRIYTAMMVRLEARYARG